jgi:hypothetical protein
MTVTLAPQDHKDHLDRREDLDYLVCLGVREPPDQKEKKD